MGQRLPGGARTTALSTRWGAIACDRRGRACKRNGDGCSLRGLLERERHSYRSWLSPLSSSCSASPESRRRLGWRGFPCHVFGRGTGGCRPCGQAPVSGVCGTSRRSSSQACRSNWCRRYCFFFPWPSQGFPGPGVHGGPRLCACHDGRSPVGQHHDGAQRCRRLLPGVLGDAVRRLRRSRSRCYGQVTLERLRSGDSAPLRGDCDNSRPPPIGCRGSTPLSL